MSAVPRNATGEIPRPRADDARLLGTLFEDAAAYRSSAQYRDLLRFVARMRRFSPFNAMLLHRQKPGLSYATTAREWRVRWKRAVTEDARPLVVLMPFGPVGFVYDVQDTEALPGAPDLPRDAFAFPAAGAVTKVAQDLAGHAKGDPVSVSGRLQFSRWTDRDGDEREQWAIVADALMSARTVRPGGRGEGARWPGVTEPAPALSSPASSAPATDFDDDIPF